MPNSKQAAKRLRQSEERRIEHKATRTAMKSAVKKVLGAQNAAEAKALLPEAMKKVDKAAKVAVVHEKTASRIKSRIARAANAKS